MIYWFIGQPSCGKTTLAKMLKQVLEDKTGQPYLHLDGDDLRHIFGNSYSKEHFTKEYRIQQTEALQRFVAHVADQGINVIVSTVNPYRDVREAFKKSRNDVKEIYVVRNGKTIREQYNVKDFEEPRITNHIIIDTTNRNEAETFDLLYNLLFR